MLRTVKIPSVTSGPYSNTNNRVDFELEQGAQYDLSQAYINLYCNVATTEDPTNDKVGVHNFEVVWTANPEHRLRNVDFIKNSRLTSSRAGILEDIRDVHILQTNLKNYTMSPDTDRGTDFKEVGQYYDQVHQRKENIFREFIKTGSVQSRELVAPVRVKLTDVFNPSLLSSVFDTDKMGRVRAHVELNLDKISVVDSVDFPVNNPPSFDVGVFKNCNGIPATGPFNVITLTAPLPDLDPVNNPYWVGCKVSISYNNGSAQTGFYLVQEISIDDNGIMSLTLDEDLEKEDPPVAITDIIISDIVKPASRTLTCDYAELVVNELTVPVKSPDMLNYYSFTTEQFTTNATQNFQRIFQCEPNAVNLMCFFPNSIVSTNEGIESFRVSINNHDVTNRDVEVHSPLYYDLVNKTLMNGDLMLKNLNEREDASNEQDYLKSVTDSKKLTSIMCPLPMTQQEKQVQIQINAGAPGVSKINLYKMVEKTIKL